MTKIVKYYKLNANWFYTGDGPHCIDELPSEPSKVNDQKEKYGKVKESSGSLSLVEWKMKKIGEILLLDEIPVDE